MSAPDIARFTRRVYDHFNSLRSLHVSQFPAGSCFWDIVVLTASDEDQRKAFDLQIIAKQKRGEIPTGIPYHVFSDPAGPRIGCGGATMKVVGELTNIYGETLKEKCILLINAGGLSQRLPSASVLGKIFTPLPIPGGVVSGDEGVNGRKVVSNWQLLELKLACYLPLLERMAPGYLHVPSDTIEVFDTGDTFLGRFGNTVAEDEWSFCRVGLTALAHPSTLEIGEGHGVFVLNTSPHNQHKITRYQQCTKVLQKPSQQQMRDSCAVVTRAEGGSSPLTHEYVYTDSLFYFDHSLAHSLSLFYHHNEPLQCEVDGYGDFMRSLGPHADPSFIGSDPVLSGTRLRLFKHLQTSQHELHVIVMEASGFYHLGTMREYIMNLCTDQQLTEYVGFSTSAFNVVCSREKLAQGETEKSGLSEMEEPAQKEMETATQGETEKPAGEIVKSGQIKMEKPGAGFPGPGRCVIHSVIGDRITIGESSVIEYCNINTCCNISIGSHCILSNCSIQSFIPSLNIPDQTFMCTVPVNVGFVTLVFHIDDDIKARGDVNSLIFLHSPLSHTLPHLPPSVSQNLFPSPHQNEGALWNARLFPVQPSMDASFLLAVRLTNRESLLDLNDELEWWSAREVFNNKNIDSMLDYRQHVYNLISEVLGRP